VFEVRIYFTVWWTWVSLIS